MKYIYSMKYFLLEKENWLDIKQKEWDGKFSDLIMPFHNTILKLIDELKDKFNDKDDPIEVNKVYYEYIETAFDNLKEQIRLVKDDDYLRKLWTELTLNFSLWKETFKKLSEKDNYSSIFKLGQEIFGVMTRYTTKTVSKKFFDKLSGEIDDQRQGVYEFIDEFYDDIKLRFDEIDPEEVFDMSNLDEKETDDLNLDSGDEVRYYMKDREENTAIISHNQEDLKDDDNVRLVSKDDAEQFEIDKSEIIEIIPKHKTVNQEVADKLKHIKSDPDKLDKLNDYLTDLEKTEEAVNIDLNKIFEGEGLEVSRNRVKTWMSNPNWKRTHIRNIGRILKSVYEPVGHWKQGPSFIGVMDLPWEEKPWSILNKINTNYSAFAIIINEINRVIIEAKSKLSPFDFNVKDNSREFYQEYERLITFLEKNKRKIFLKLSDDDGSRLLNKIIETITSTTKVGDAAEKLTEDLIPKLIDGASNAKAVEEAGNAADMLQGVDLTFDLNGVEKTVQVKKCKGVFHEKKQYKIVGTNLSKHYKVDYIVCINNTHFYMFKYDENLILRKYNGDLSIDETLLVRSYKLV